MGTHTSSSYPSRSKDSTVMADTAKKSDEGQKAENVSVDGLTVIDMTYYHLLGVRADATDAQIKTAYRKAALKNHPDRNRDDPNAEAKFQEIGEAYQILSDSNLRAVYDRRGKKSSEAGLTPEDGFEDPGALFAKLFGGERFMDWIGEISLGKDFSKAMDISMTEEEKETMKAEMAAGGPGPGAGAATVQADATSASPAAPASAVDGGVPAAGTTSGSETTATTSTTMPSASATAGAPGGTDLHKASASGTSTPTSLSAAAAPDASGGSKSGKPAKHSNKLTAEQRKQMDELASERRKAELERITVLTNKLKDRIRPYTQATLGNTSDLEMQRVETQRWENRIKEEIEDLKGESFGLELCRLIGQIYVSKAHLYLKTHKSPLSNLFGLSSFWGKMKDRGSTIKEGWSFLSSAMEEQGEVAEADMAKMEEAMVGKVMLVTWRGTRFEVSSVLRQVVDGVLSKEPGVTEVELAKRAQAILIIGSLLKNVQVDETDEERREMERLVAAAAQKKPKKAK